jgi:hypothetical protein
MIQNTMSRDEIESCSYHGVSRDGERAYACDRLGGAMNAYRRCRWPSKLFIYLGSCTWEIAERFLAGQDVELKK